MNCYPSRSKNCQALTVIEIMVSSVLMVMIVFGLMIMFNATQRAFRSSLRQVDVLEGGRAIMDVVVRDFEQASNPFLNITSLYVKVDTSKGVDLELGTIFSNQNFQADAFVLWPENLAWHGVGYWSSNDGRGLATLFRAEVEVPQRYVENRGNRLLPLFFGRPPTADDPIVTYGQIAQGITHFFIRPWTNQWEYKFNTGNKFEAAFSNNLPQMVEIELGIAEPEVIERLKAMPDDATARDFLSKQANKIHIFRQQVAIKTAIQ